jgi:hypothetical protein
VVHDCPTGAHTLLEVLTEPVLPSELELPSPVPDVKVVPEVKLVPEVKPGPVPVNAGPELLVFTVETLPAEDEDVVDVASHASVSTTAVAHPTAS